MTLEELMEVGDRASISIAAGHDRHWQGKYLEPRLWEGLRIEMQRRLRRSTGELHAIVSFSFGEDAS